MQTPTTRTPMLPPEVTRLVQGELRPGERLAWAGQPLPRLYRGMSIGLAVFGVVFTGFALFWVAGSAAMLWSDHSFNRPPGVLKLFPLFGLPFVLVGLGMLSAPVWMAKQARRTAYAVTDQRAICFRGGLFGGGVTVQSFDPVRLTSLTRRERADGSGDLVFEEFTQRRGTGSVTVRRGFMAVDDVRGVEELIHKTLLTGRTRAV